MQEGRQRESQPMRRGLGGSCQCASEKVDGVGGNHDSDDSPAESSAICEGFDGVHGRSGGARLIDTKCGDSDNGDTVAGALESSDSVNNENLTSGAGEVV